jgi:hypothetical protein
MAHELPDARSLLQLRSTRVNSRGQLESNIVFSYPNCTIPRHLRDVVITEYGIADLRGKTDQEVARALIEVADSRFQDSLIQQAVRAGKLPQGFELRPRFRNNLPKRYQVVLQNYRTKQLFSPFPLGTDLTAQEIKLGRALKWLKKKSQKKVPFLLFVMSSMIQSPPDSQESRDLDRMCLEKPRNLKELLYKNLILSALRNI